MTDTERLELQTMTAGWRRHSCLSRTADYADGYEDGMYSASYDLEDFLCRTDN